MTSRKFLLALCLALGYSSHATAILIGTSDMPPMQMRVQNPAINRHIEGLQALEKNDWAAAELAFRESMSLDNKAPQPLLGLADLALRNKNTTEAWSWLEKALKLAPQNALVHQAIGRYHFASGQHSKAIEALKKAEQLNPSSALIPIDLGEIYMQALRKPDEAASAYRRALNIDPQHAGAHYGLGTALATSGKLVDAEVEFNKASSLSPNNPLPGQSLGRLYMQQGQTDKAINAFDSVLRAAPNFVPALLDKGDIYLGKGDLNRALTEFQKAAKVSPNNDMAHLKLGMAYQGQGHRTEAENAYQMAIKINPKLALAYNNLAWMATESGKNLNQAEQWAKTSVKLGPGVSSFQDTLGWVYRSQKKPALAEQTLLKASEMKPASAETFYHLGMVYLDQNKNKEAEMAFRKALSIQKDYMPAQQALAKLSRKN